MKKLGISLDGVIRDYLTQFDKQYRKVYINNPNIVEMNTEFQAEEPTDSDIEALDKKIETDAASRIFLPVDTDNLLNHYKFEEEIEEFGGVDEAPIVMVDEATGMLGENIMKDDREWNIKEKIVHSPKECLEKFMYEKYPFQIFGDADAFSGAMEQFNRIQAFGLRNKLFETILISDLKANAIPTNYFFLHKTGSRARNIRIVENVEEMWNMCDVVVDVKQETFHQKPDGKISIRINKPYNQYAEADYSLNSLKELNNDILLKKLFE